MTAGCLIKAIGNISDKYIMEYDTATNKERGNSRTQFNHKWSIAACLAVILITTLVCTHIYDLSTTLVTKTYIFLSYDEFSTVVVNANIVENLSYISGIELDIYGNLKDVSVKGTTRAENYDCFDIIAKSGKNIIATIKLTLDAVSKAEKHINNSALITVINDIPVYYAYDDDAENWDCVVVVNEDYYNIHYYSADENELIKFLTTVLEQ